MSVLKKSAQAKASTNDNVEYVLRDAQGNIKPMFQDNALSRFLLKHGILSPYWINGKYASILSPFLGSWSMKRKLSNLVTTVGKAAIASRINGNGGEAAAGWIAVGTGASAAAAGDTTLGTELAVSGLSRAAVTASRVTTDVTNDTARHVVTFTVSGTAAVTEAGLFNASSAGVLFARQVFSAVNVVSGDSLQVTWDLDVD